MPPLPRQPRGKASHHLRAPPAPLHSSPRSPGHHPALFPPPSSFFPSSSSPSSRLLPPSFPSPPPIPSTLFKTSFLLHKMASACDTCSHVTRRPLGFGSVGLTPISGSLPAKTLGPISLEKSHNISKSGGLRERSQETMEQRTLGTLRKEKGKRHGLDFKVSQLAESGRRGILARSRDLLDLG